MTTTNIHTQKFNTLTDFYNYLESTPTREGVKRNSSHDGTESFTNTKSYDEANDLLLHGDREIAKRLNEHGVTNFSKRIQATRPKAKMQQSLGGFMPNVPAYLAGAKKQMFRIQKQQVKQRVITIVYNLAASWCVKAEDIEMHAADLMKAVMAIEASGTRVNLYFTSAVRHKRSLTDQTVMPLVKIKDSGQYLDILKMCYPMVHASMLRRHFFRYLEVAKGVNNGFTNGGGYGIPTSNKSIIISGLKKCGLHDARVISYKDELEHTNTVQQVVELIMNQK